MTTLVHMLGVRHEGTHGFVLHYQSTKRLPMRRGRPSSVLDEILGHVGHNLCIGGATIRGFTLGTPSRPAIRAATGMFLTSLSHQFVRKIVGLIFHACVCCKWEKKHQRWMMVESHVCTSLLHRFTFFIFFFIIIY